MGVGSVGIHLVEGGLIQVGAGLRLVQVGAGLRLVKVGDGECKGAKAAKGQTLEGIEAGNC